MIDERAIRFPGRLEPYPVPPGAAEALGQGSTPFRQVFTVANQLKVIRAGPAIVVGLLAVSTAAAVRAYLVDSNNESISAADIIAQRKAPAIAPLGLMDGWLAPNRDVAPRVTQGVAVIADQADAEVFVFIKE